MSPATLQRLVPLLLQFTPLVLFAVIVAGFSLANPSFRGSANLLDILEQSVPVAIVSIGMTFVLLTAGIDLAVGSTMYLAVVVVGLFFRESSPLVGFAVAAAIGLLLGLLNAVAVVWCRVAPFIVTLSTMFMVRGFGKRMTETKAVFAPSSITDLERAAILGLPWAVWMLLGVAGLSWLLLRQTGFGRRIYAVGQNTPAAAKAGINVPLTLWPFTRSVDSVRAWEGSSH